MKTMKVFSLMLLLTVLSITSVSSQVRIGGSEAPNAAAILDLNATDETNDGTGGLALPRVNLTSGTAQLNGVTPLNGTLVYNTNAELGVGVYCWDTDKWVKVSNTADTKFYSQESFFSLPFPRVLARVDFHSVDYNSINKGNPVNAIMRYDDYDGHFFEKKILVEFQGSSSMAYDKKNFTIDILNDDGSDCDVRFGDWAVFDSYNLKANYIDFTQARNVAIARLSYQASCMRPFGQRFPWEIAYSGTNTTLNQRFDSGARGRIDGFPMELYINGEYWGLYTFNIKKTRKNFDMKKGDKTKILMYAETHNDFTRYIPEQWDIKNPDPVSAETQAAIDRLFSWMNTMNTDDSQFLSQYEQYWNKNEWIDYYIFLQVFFLPDCVFKNMAMATWDGSVWSPMPYDLDTSFGLHWQGILFYENSETQTVDRNLITYMPWKLVHNYWVDDVKTRYAELRKTVLSDKNVEKTIKSITDIFGIDNYERDAKRWPGIPSNSLCYTGLNQLMDWYQKRTAFLDDSGEW